MSKVLIVVGHARQAAATALRMLISGVPKTPPISA
jgi:hypothetical protein